MSRSTVLLLAIAAVALSEASARLAPDDVAVSEALTGRQLLGDNCKEKDGCQWCEDASGEKEHNSGYECQPSTYILGGVMKTLGGILGGHGSKDNKWCRVKEPKEPSCNKGWFYSDKSVSDCQCEGKGSGYCCHQPPTPPDCSGMPSGHKWDSYLTKPSGCECEKKDEGYCCYPTPTPPDCSSMSSGHKWDSYLTKPSGCECEKKDEGYCCYPTPTPPDCSSMPSGHKWDSYLTKPAGCECEKKDDGYCCYKKEAPQPKPTCQEAYGSSYFANEHAKRSGCSCKKAPGHGYCCKKVAAPKPRCVQQWYYGKNRNFCEDSKPDKTKFCIVYNFGGVSVGCCAKKEKNDYDDDRCFYKSFNNKMRKCCYDSSRKMKKDKKHHSCITSSYKGYHGDFCYDNSPPPIA